MRDEPITLKKIEHIKDKMIFGIDLDKFKNLLNYKALELTSIEVGKYSINNYKILVEEDISSIQPIYLNEYKIEHII